MAKKTVYLENALEGLMDELTTKVAGKKQGDRVSISAYYGKDEKLFRQSEINATLGALYQIHGIALEQLPCTYIGTKIVFQLVGREDFEKLFTIKESKGVKLADKKKVDKTQDEVLDVFTNMRDAWEEQTSDTVSVVKEEKVEYTGSAFEQVKALIPSLTDEERKELIKLLKA